MSSTQRTQHQHTAGYDVEESLIQKKAEECVQYILYCYLADRKVIIRRGELNKNVLKDYSKSFRNVFAIVEKCLLDVFGLSLVDLDGNNKLEKFGVRSKFQFDSELNGRDLKSNSDADAHESDQQFQEQVKYSMIMIALSIIFMNENEMDEDLFFESLKKLDINREEKKHKYLGDVFKYFTNDLVKDGYLEYEKASIQDPPKFKFKWGIRSKLEITKQSVLEFVCQVFGGDDLCKPEDWVQHFQDASKQDEFNQSDIKTFATNNINSTQQQAQSASNDQDDEDDDDDDDEDDDNSIQMSAPRTSQTRRGVKSSIAFDEQIMSSERSQMPPPRSTQPIRSSRRH